MAWKMGGTVSKCDHREYGFAQLEVVKFKGKGQSGSDVVDALFEGLGDDMQVCAILSLVLLYSLCGWLGLDVSW
jgi:GMP synthase-like glutamine amidotransferase